MFHVAPRRRRWLPPHPSEFRSTAPGCVRPACAGAPGLRTRRMGDALPAAKQARGGARFRLRGPQPLELERAAQKLRRPRPRTHREEAWVPCGLCPFCAGRRPTPTERRRLAIFVGLFGHMCVKPFCSIRRRFAARSSRLVARWRPLLGRMERVRPASPPRRAEPALACPSPC